MIRVEIDPHSGFCGGVIRAIGTAEAYLRDKGAPLWSLGAIVHNEEELSRLRGLGLVDIGSLGELGEDVSGKHILIRAHGEPPEVYRAASQAGLEVIDCTCPVVLRLQKAIREAYASVSAAGGQILLFGKTGHPEVLGLVGQVGGDVVVFQNLGQLRGLVADGSVRVNRDIVLFSQTTMSPSEYSLVGGYLSSVMRDGAALTVHDTICSQVASRYRELSEFARSHDVLVFVSGKESSNGKVLFELCAGVNPRSHHLISPDALRKEWFAGAESAGVCGATSTPKWLLEKVARGIENLQ